MSRNSFEVTAGRQSHWRQLRTYMKLLMPHKTATFLAYREDSIVKHH